MAELVDNKTKCVCSHAYFQHQHINDAGDYRGCSMIVGKPGFPRNCPCDHFEVPTTPRKAGA